MQQNSTSLNAKPGNADSPKTKHKKSSNFDGSSPKNKADKKSREEGDRPRSSSEVKVTPKTVGVASVGTGVVAASKRQRRRSADDVTRKNVIGRSGEEKKQLPVGQFFRKGNVKNGV